MPTKTDKANVVTTIPGYDENENYRDSAIPRYFDEWFHGDFDTTREQSLTNATSTKNLEEYTQAFPDFRINSAIEISFDTPDNQTVSNPSASMTDPNNSNSPGGISEVTLEGAPDEEPNPFRSTEYDYDGTQNFLNATVKGPLTAGAKVVGPIGPNNIEGVRASLILGGSDPYLGEARTRGDLYDIIRTESGFVPSLILQYLTQITSFYSFLDFVFMADGTKLVRVWDVSAYPAHALYVGEDKKDQTPFEEGSEWTPDGPLREQTAFIEFGIDGNTPGVTPFDASGSWQYKERFSDPLTLDRYPVMEYGVDGTETTADTIRSEFLDPLFPPSL